MTLVCVLMQAEKQAQAQAAAAAVVNAGGPDLRQPKWEHGQLQYQVGKVPDGMLYASNQAPNTSSTNDLCDSPLHVCNLCTTLSHTSPQLHQ